MHKKYPHFHSVLDQIVYKLTVTIDFWHRFEVWWLFCAFRRVFGRYKYLVLACCGQLANIAFRCLTASNVNELIWANIAKTKVASARFERFHARSCIRMYIIMWQPYICRASRRLSGVHAAQDRFQPVCIGVSSSADVCRCEFRFVNIFEQKRSDEIILIVNEVIACFFVKCTKLRSCRNQSANKLETILKQYNEQYYIKVNFQCK